MKDYSDLDLTNKIKESSDEGALVELVNRHSGIYIDMIKRFGLRSLPKDIIGNIIDEKEYNIYKAAIDYDETRAKFSTHLANKTKFICLTEKTKMFKNKENTNYNELEFCQHSTDNTPDESFIEKERYVRVMNMIFEHKDKRIRTIFTERYFNGKLNKLKPWHQIAKKVGLSTQGCINIHNKTIEQFKNKIKNETIKF